jgi:hypothetical protein
MGSGRREQAGRKSLLARPLFTAWFPDDGPGPNDADTKGRARLLWLTRTMHHRLQTGGTGR